MPRVPSHVTGFSSQVAGLALRWLVQVFVEGEVKALSQLCSCWAWTLLRIARIELPLQQAAGRVQGITSIKDGQINVKHHSQRHVRGGKMSTLATPFGGYSPFNLGSTHCFTLSSLNLGVAWKKQTNVHKRSQNEYFPTFFWSSFWGLLTKDHHQFWPDKNQFSLFSKTWCLDTNWVMNRTWEWLDLPMFLPK